MKNRMSPMRHYSRFPVSWRVVYGTSEFVAEGTVLDLTIRGWRRERCRLYRHADEAAGLRLKVNHFMSYLPRCCGSTIIIAIEADEMARR